MSYLSLISCTDLDVLCVATKMRSAYSSVSKRETSFSRIGLDSVGIVIRLSIRFSDLILADRERCARFAEDFQPHTIGRSSAFGKPPDQSHERLNNSVDGFCPERTTGTFTPWIRKTAEARVASIARDAM